MGDIEREERKWVAGERCTADAVPSSVSAATDPREQDLERRERRGAGRTAAADQRQRWLDDRERDVGAREADAQAVMTRLGALALSLQDLDDVESTLQAIMTAAVDTVPAAAHAGLSIISRRRVSPIVTTDEVVSLIDRAQQETGEGPAVTSLRERRTVRVDDIATDARWPRFAVRATRAGVGSLLAVRLFVHGDELGVLSLYSGAPHAFDDDAEQLAVLFAAHAAVAVAGARHQQNMTAALTARDDIGQAKGILMERYRLDAERAFAVLVRASQDTNTKLVDVVRVLLRTGVLGTGPHDEHHDGRRRPRRP